MLTETPDFKYYLWIYNGKILISTPGLSFNSDLDISRPVLLEFQ